MRAKKSSGAWRPILSRIKDARRTLRMGIYAQDELRDLILYEKARSDRDGSHLSLVVYDVLEKRAVRKLITELSHSIRATDHLGWFSGAQIGVLLPGTGPKGARRFVEQFVETSGMRDLVNATYSYPDRWLSGGNGNNSHGLTAAREPETGGPLRHTWSRNEYLALFARPVPQWKRILDVVGALLGLALSAPVWLLLSAYIKLVSPGPVLFKQNRVGLGRREFPFLKFRTMHIGNNESVHTAHARAFIRQDGAMKKLDDSDPRIIPGGRVVRVLCIDEIPQLLNVLRGEMSLVGPRPCIPYEAQEYFRWHTHRFSVLPGLTGIWQVSGKNNLTFQEMIRLDIAYEKNLSLALDIKIIFMTIPAIAAYTLQDIARRVARGTMHVSDPPRLSGADEATRQMPPAAM